MDSRGIRYADYATKIELHELIKTNKPKSKTQHVDCKLAQHEGISLGLSPYHSELNAKKNIWDITRTKNWLTARNVTFKFHD